MNLIRLPRHQHPKPPHRELRQETVLDLDGRLIGQVANLSVDDDREFSSGRIISGQLGLRTKHTLFQ